MAGENKNGLVYDPNDPNYKIKPAAAMPLSSTGQQPASTPVVVDGQQATATTTPDVKQPVTNSDLDAQVAKRNEVIDPVTLKPKEQLAQMDPSLETDTGTETVKPKYLAEWTPNSNVYNEAKRLNIPLQQALADYWRWGNDTGNPTSWIDYAYQDMDLSKTPEQIEEEKKRQESKERWDKVGNFLLHLGNVIGNVAGGGMGAVQLEDPVKYTERQRLLKEKTLERRRAYNQSYFARMRQEDADRRRAEMEKRRQDRLDKETKIRQEKNDAYRQYQQSLASKNEAMTAYYQAKVEALEQGLPLEEALKKAKVAKEEAQARLANTKANAGGFAPQRPVQEKETTTTTTKVDSLGDKTTTTTTKRTGPVGSTSSQNTPPSRRNTSTTSRRNTSTTSRRNTSSSSNTPPSRRR